MDEQKITIEIDVEALRILLDQFHYLPAHEAGSPIIRILRKELTKAYRNQK